MILYVNGDSHTAAAEAVTPHAFAEDDSQYFYLGRAPHPANLAVSWGRRLADTLKMGLNCQAQAGGSNARIMRTTREHLFRPDVIPGQYFVIIQWSTWERQEWFFEDVWHQVGASGTDGVPEVLRERYRQFVSAIDWRACVHDQHAHIWDFHQELQDHGIRHVFFNGNNDFSLIKHQKPWGLNYIGPYDSKSTYSAWLQRQGFQTVAPDSWHFGPEAHTAWARFVLQYCVSNKLVP
jgi:hypothetical protein